MPRGIHFVNRSLTDGLIKIYTSSRCLSLCSFLLICLISSIIPLSILWFMKFMYYDISIMSISSISYLNIFLTIWSLAEILFFIYQSYLYSLIQSKIPAPYLTSNERNKIISNSLSNIKHLESTLSKWFMNRRLENVDRQSLIGWLAFAFFSKHSRELHDREYEEINVLITKLTNDHYFKLADDEISDKIVFMKHILDPVRVIFRPLILYFVTDTLLDGILLKIIFYSRGYQFVQIGHLQFWTYHNEECQIEEDPIIFFHGIGAGLLMYQPFLAHVHKRFSNKHRMIFISMRCICMRYPSLNDIPDMSETVESLHLIFDYYKLKKAIFIGHSYGTACLSWIVKMCSNYISRLIFLDPICFGLFEPYVIYNFVYRNPFKLGHLYMYYFVCRELGISYVISRHFWWIQNNLFFEEISRHENKTIPVHVLLSGRDCIVNVQLIKDYLIDKHIDYYLAPHLCHGGFMHDEKSWEKICQWIS